MIIENNSISKKITFLFFFLFFLIGVLTYKDYGISVDEEFQRSSGLYWLNYILNFTPFNEFANEVAQKFQQSKGFTISDAEIHKYYGVIFDLPAVLLEIIFDINDSRNFFYFKHFLTFSLFFFGSIFFYKLLLNRFSNNFIALMGTIFFVFSPRIYGNSFYNPKDIIFLSILCMAMYFCFKLFDRSNYKNFFIFSIFCALACSQRMWGLFLPISFIGFYFLSVLSKKKEFEKIYGVVFFSFSFLLFFVIFWPYLWSNPVVNLIEAFKYFSHHGTLNKIQILFNGDYVKANSVPYSYIPIWILITTPTLYILLFTLGYLSILKRFFLKFINIKENKIYHDLWRGSNEKKDLFVIFNFTFILFYLIFFNISIFTGWRHLYFMNIFIIYIASYAFYIINIKLKSKVQKKIFYSFIFVYMFFLAYKMFIYHPYQNIYFNSVFNKTNKSIHEKFEIDYWGLSGKRFLEKIISLEKNKTSIQVASASFIPLERSKKLLLAKDREKIKVVGQEYHKADYIFLNFTSEVNKKFNDKYKIPPYFLKINSLVIDNIVVYEVYKNNK